jgi:hypothetical protein
MTKTGGNKTMGETAMETAMRKAGGPRRREARLTVAIAEFQNNGGTYDEADRLLRAAYGLSGEGHTWLAEKGHPSRADARQPNGDGAGHRSSAGDGLNFVARPSPTERSGEGHPSLAGKATRPVPSTAAPHRERDGHNDRAGEARRAVPPAREPSLAQRNAAIEARKASAKAVLDLGWLGDAHVPGGPKYTDLRVRDLPGMIERQLQEGATHARAAVAIRLIEKAIAEAGVADQEARWVDVLPADRVREIARATETETLRPMAVGWLRSLNDTAGQMIEGGRNHG